MNTASTGATNVWAMLVTLVSLPLLLHGMGTEAFGVWALIQTFSGLSGWLSLASVPLGTATARGVADHVSRDDLPAVRRVAGASLLLAGALGLATALVLIVGGWTVLPTLLHIDGAMRTEFQMAIALFGAQATLDLVGRAIGACLEGVQRIDVSRGIEAARRTAVATATAAAALAGGGLVGVAAASIGATALGTLTGAAVLARFFPGRPAMPRQSDVWEVTRYSGTVSILSGSGILHRTMDRLIVGAALGPSAVAVVEVATQVQNGVSAVLGSTSFAFIPAAAWYRAQEDLRALRRMIGRGTKYSLLVTLPVVALTAVLAGPLLRLWVGDDVAADATPLVVLAVLYLGLVAPLQVGGDVLQGIGRAGTVIMPALVAVVVNLAVSLVLVGPLDEAGVFIATLVSGGVLVPMLGSRLLRALELDAAGWVREAIAPTVVPLVALLGCALTVTWLPLGDPATVVLACGLGGAAYLAAVARWSVTRGERSELRTALA